jgi:hypothetical protein
MGYPAFTSAGRSDPAARMSKGRLVPPNSLVQAGDEHGPDPGTGR